MRSGRRCCSGGNARLSARSLGIQVVIIIESSSLHAEDFPTTRPRPQSTGTGTVPTGSAISAFSRAGRRREKVCCSEATYAAVAADAFTQRAMVIFGDWQGPSLRLTLWSFWQILCLECPRVCT